ncbi:MAG: protoporphyrinogen oxidase HemJ [Methyloligellaceae bacterium]
MLFLWIKALHIMAFIAWMAGLFYLPRLFVYHARPQTGKDMSETFEIMERRLLKAIMNPAMLVTWATGLSLGYMLGQFSSEIQIWFALKLVLILGLTVYHMALGRWRREFAEDRNTHSEKFYRFINEVPTLIMIAVVILVIFQPF